MSEDRFLLVTCQRGAETALKQEFAHIWPEWRASFSRPGFVTFKLPAEFVVPTDWSPRSVFARSCCWYIGRVSLPSDVAVDLEPADLTKQLSSQVEQCLNAGESLPHKTWSRLHVWSRDLAAIGYRNYEPEITPAAIAAQTELQSLLSLRIVAEPGSNSSQGLRVGQQILDVIQVEPHEWWIGEHAVRAGEPWSRWPGGIFQCNLEPTIVSRAYLKMREALTCFRPPMKRGETVIEIGSAPGGASQALLEQGLKVIGVDPAQMDPTLLANSDFTHWQMRGNELRKTRLRGIKWLTADINVAPQYTLDTVEEIVTNQNVRIAGLILTIKLPEWSLAKDLNIHRKRVKSWGYKKVRTRQLSHNRQEYCLYATREKND